MAERAADLQQGDQTFDYPGAPPMLTSQLTPNRSMHMPNSSPHFCFSSTTATVPPSDNQDGPLPDDPEEDARIDRLLGGVG